MTVNEWATIAYRKAKELKDWLTTMPTYMPEDEMVGTERSVKSTCCGAVACNCHSEHHTAKPITDPYAQAHMPEIGRRLQELAEQDPALRWLPLVLLERLRVMCARGDRYNGEWSSLKDQVFYMGDQSAYHAAMRPLQRMRQTIGDHGYEVPTEHIVDMIIDGSNYLDLWRACRMEREANR